MAAVATTTETYSLGGTANLYVGTIAFDAAYPAGGEAIDVGANERIDILLCPANGGYVYSWDAANQKLLVYQQTDPADAGGADVPLAQATGADLATLTAVPFLAVGN